MRSISVCVGSSCHLKGAYDVINEFRRLLGEHSLTEEFELKACFCLGRCQDGVSLLLDDELYTSITKDTVEKFFDEQINHLK